MSATWPEALAALETPPGRPGSGRQRYGAAMTLWREGLITPEVLEVFRIASAVDAQDPAPMLAEAGLPQPGHEIPALAAAAAVLIAAMPGEGIADVSAGLAAAEPVAPGPRPNAVVAAHLSAALGAVTDPRAAALAAAIRAAAPWLGWITYDLYPPEEIGPAFGAGHAFAPIASGEDFELGVFLIAPGVFYRDHAHAAPELYLPLNGPHGWRFSPGAPLVWKPALAPVWNPSHAHHATKVGEVPFLCLYGWTRDILQPAYVLRAQDWPALEGRA